MCGQNWPGNKQGIQYKVNVPQEQRQKKTGANL